MSGPAHVWIVLGVALGIGVGPSHVGSTPAAIEAGPAPHELHETYADIAVEGSVVGGRFLFFKEQIEAALGPLVDADAVSLTPGTEADVLVLRYLRDHVSVEADGVLLQPSLLDSGEERLAHHKGWWVVVQFPAEASVTELRIRNTLLFEIHDDQRNIMKVAWFPAGVPETYTATPGAEEVVARGGSATQ